MATSNSIDFLVSTKEIIQEAHEILGVVGEGQSINTEQYQTGLRTLNMMAKTWQAKGLNLFAVQETFLFLRQNQIEYTLTGTTTDHWTTQFSETTTSAAALAAATSIDLADSTGISDGDFIGVKTDAGEILHWTTVSDASGAPTIVLTEALPADVSSGATVYFYTNKANRPMKLLEAYTVRFTGNGQGTDIPIGIIGRVDYGELSNKQSSGVVNQIYQDPQVQDFKVSVWPVADSERDYLRLFVKRRLQDFDCAIHTPDYPEEWYAPLAWGLALLLTTKYGVPDQTYNRVKGIAKSLYDAADGFDQENETSVFLKPDTWGRDVARSGA